VAANDHHSAMTPIMDSLDDGRIAFDDRDEVPLATDVDPVCGRRLRCADAVSAIDYQGAPIFFCSTACREHFDASPARYVTKGQTRPQSTE
jgi:YHS domain-containing protein